LEPTSDDFQESQLSLKEIFISIIIGFILATITAFILPEFESKSNLILGQFVFVAPLLIYLRIKNFNFQISTRFYPCNYRILFVSIVIGLSAAVLSDEIDRIVTHFIEIPEELEKLTTEIVHAETLIQGIVIVVAIILMASIFEEILFRGVLQSALENKMDAPHAIFVTALIFSFFHMPQWMIQIILLGLLLSYMAWRSGSIIPGIIVHLINNSLAVLFYNTDWLKWDWYNWSDHVNPPVIAVSACLLFYGIKIFHHLTSEKENLTSPIN